PPPPPHARRHAHVRVHVQRSTDKHVNMQSVRSAGERIYCALGCVCQGEGHAMPELHHTQTGDVCVCVCMCVCVCVCERENDLVCGVAVRELWESCVRVKSFCRV